MTALAARDQLAAARLGVGAMRVVAGAGTGKTAVFAERFRRLVVAGAAPESILVMTFTERAAGEMRRRIEELAAAGAPAVGTFHSMALGWLRADGRAIGVPPGFRIVTGAERWILARELMWKLGDAALTADDRPDDLVAPALSMLERLKQELVPLERLAAWAAASDDAERSELMRACVRLYRAYERECRRRHWLDFDDLLLLAVRLLETRPAVLERYTSTYRHVLVDEYQDLNLAQERLVELIARGGDPFVVGDDDQSIYRFRGASRASLERFLNSFPLARTTTLGRNRRSSRRIVAAASALIAHNPDRLPKELRADRPGPPVEVWECADGASEALAIARQAAELIESGLAPASIAVLCRTNAIARPVAGALAAEGVPHVVVGGHGFYDLDEIKDVVAILRVLHDPSEVIPLVRVLTRPPVRLDVESTLRRLRERGSLTPLEAIASWGAGAPWATLLTELAAAALKTDVRDLFFETMERTGYLVAAVRELPPSDAGRVAANVGRLAEEIAEFCESSPDHSLGEYLRHLDLVLLSGEDAAPTAGDEADGVHVMTIHQSKGLEFDAVFVPSVVEGRLPQSGRSPRFELPPAVLEPLVRGREDVVAEERRLLYVAMTRARARLYLSVAARYEGGRRWRESRFIAEIGEAGARVVTRRTLPGSPAPPEAPAVESGRGDVQLSYSAMTVYRDCPRQYWYRYVERLPAPQSAEAVHGVILHEVLRRAAEAKQSGQPVTGRLVESLHAEAWRRTPFPDPRRAPTFRRNGERQLRAYLEGGGFDATPAYVEHEFTVPVDGWTLRGVIDRIDRVDAGWRIIDYKTGRPVARRRRDLQVALYALAARSALDLDPVELEVTSLATGESVRVEKVDGLVAEARNEGSEVAAGIRARRFEARPEPRRCRLCPYRLCCVDAL